MNENEIAKIIVDAAYKVHSRLGPGLLEAVYEVLLAHEIGERGLRVERQVPIPIEYNGIKFQEGFRADMIVEGKVIIEIKSVETIQRVHKKQLLTYLRLTEMKLGLLINFGTDLIKNGVSRVLMGCEFKTLRSWRLACLKPC